MELSIKIPNSLSEITLGQWQDWEEFKSNNTELKEIDLHKKIIEIFCELPKEVIESLEYSEFERLANLINELFETQPEELITRFNMLGTDMGFIPNLSKLSIGEFIDLESFISETDTFHLAMGVLYRPVSETKTIWGVERYEIQPYNPIEELENVYKEIPLDVAISARVFFWSLERDLLQTSLTSLKAQTKRIQKKRNKTSQEREFLMSSGDGITQFTDLLTKMQQKWTKPQLSL